MAKKGKRAPILSNQSIDDWVAQRMQEEEEARNERIRQLNKLLF